jgi:hypothetical protein
MLEELFEQLRDILRRNGAWNVVISVWSLYGTYQVEVFHLSVERFTTRGMNLDLRLRECIEYLAERGVK